MSKGRAPTFKSPQQKKAESYAKDRRNVYGENSKASRKNIPKRKAAENRSSRRNTKRQLDTLERLNEPELDLVESSARIDEGRIGGWRKSPDQPLGQYLGKRPNRTNVKKSRRSRLQVSAD